MQYIIKFHPVTNPFLTCTLALGLSAIATVATAAELKFDGATAEVYKTVGDVKLMIYRFTPAGHKPGDKRAAAVFFFGGGWNGGTPKQFEAHSRYLASRGMVAFVADYRVKSRQKTDPFACVEDAKAAVRYLRGHAAELGVDPERIAVGGGSAGGHLAACTGILEGCPKPTPGWSTAFIHTPRSTTIPEPSRKPSSERPRPPNRPSAL